MSCVGKKLINNVKDCVDENLAGLVAIHPGLRLIPQHRIVFREDLEEMKSKGIVGLMSGSGAGHEPGFAGYVGSGMLSAAVSGSVFASPPVSNILAAIRLLAKGNPSGVLMIVLSYTGDRLNFGQAEEIAKAESINVQSFLVSDDCALVSDDASAGRRGLSGAIFIMKIAGAMAQRGHSLQEILTELHQLSSNIGTIGLSLTACTLPGSGPNFVLGPDEMELGLGIHGEAGVARIKLQSAKETVSLMLGHMTNRESSTRLELDTKTPIAVIINNLGGTSQIEMNIIALEVINWLENRGYHISRAFCATLLTSLEMAGVSITIFRITSPTYVDYLDDETCAISWPRSNNSNRKLDKRSTDSQISISTLDLGAVAHADIQCDQITPDMTVILQECIQNSCNSLISNKDFLNDLDSGCGDGDCGTTLSTGAQEILKQLAGNLLNTSHPYKTFLEIASICQQNMGGASGALYSIFFTAAATKLQKNLGAESIILALQYGTSAIGKHGGARIGDRTMLDALNEATSSFQTAIVKLNESSCDLNVLIDAFVKCAAGTKMAAKATCKMAARAGRASYVNASLTKGKADAGAQAVALIFEAIAETLSFNANL